MYSLMWNSLDCISSSVQCLICSGRGLFFVDISTVVTRLFLVALLYARTVQGMYLSCFTLTDSIVYRSTQALSTFGYYAVVFLSCYLYMLLARSVHRCSCFELQHGRAIAQAVSRRLSIAAARIRVLVTSCGICGGTKWHWGRFSPSTSVSPANLHSTSCSTVIIIYYLGLVQ
jgi:hypothetical protein